VTLALDRVPFSDGAREVVELGIFSSLQPQNMRLRRAIRDLAAAGRHPLFPLIFDPQTAGGLIAGVSLAKAERCVDDLRAAGYSKASVIGLVGERSAALEPVVLDLTGAVIARALSECRDTMPDPGRAREESVLTP